MENFSQPRLLTSVVSTQKNPESPQSSLTVQDLASVMVSTKITLQENPVVSADAHGDLVKLMDSPAINSFLAAANDYARAASLPPAEALSQIILQLKQMDMLWDQALLREGLARLSTQFH